MAKTSIGIDIGLNSLKLVELEKDGKDRFKLRRAFIRYMPDGWAVTDKKKNDVLSSILKEVRETQEISKGRPVSLSLPSNSVFIRYVDVMRTKRAKESELIEYEARQQIPLSIDEVSWDYRTLETSEDGSQKAVLVALKRDNVDSAVESVNYAGFNEKAVSLSLFSLLRLAKMRSKAKKSEGIIVVDIGLESTGIIVSRGSHVWLRSFSFAGRHFTESISTEMDVDYQHAETVKTEGPSTLGDAGDTDLIERISNIVRSDLEELSGEVERTLNYYKMEYITTDPLMSEDSFKQFHVFLSGGGSKISGLAEFLSERLGLRVSTLGAFTRVRADAKVLKKCFLGSVNMESEDLVSEVEPLLAVAVGAAIDGFEKEGPEINFVKKKLAADRSFSLTRYFRLLSYLFFIAALAVNFYYDREKIGLYSQRLDLLKTDADQMDTYSPQMESIAESLEKISTKKGFLTNYVQKKYLWLKVLQDITRILPDDMWLTGLNAAGDYMTQASNEMTLNGVTLSYDQLNDFIVALREIDNILEVKPESVVNDNERFNFLIKMRVANIERQES